jgi:hypothetical protein
MGKDWTDIAMIVSWIGAWSALVYLIAISGI